VVLVVGLHLEQGYCVRFPASVDGEPLETWEEWDEIDFLAPEGTIDTSIVLPASVLAEAREVLDEATTAVTCTCTRRTTSRSGAAPHAMGLHVLQSLPSEMRRRI